MSGFTFASGELTQIADAGTRPGTDVPGLAARLATAERAARARSDAVGILDAAMLLFAAVLAEAGTVAAGLPSPGLGALLVFGGVCFLLLRTSRLLVDGRLGALGGVGLLSVPVVTAAAASALALVQIALIGTGDAVVESARPWLLATAYLLAGRLALAWALSGRSPVAVAAVLDRGAKRAFDCSIALLLLVFTAPVIALVALAIKLEDRGPVFYRCRRLGESGTDLRMLKFRKMQHDADGPPLTAAEDERFTRVGRFLAVSKLDELPQLWNVVRGEMSLVGPRPEDFSFVAMRPHDFEAIAAVKPGVTGLCQLAFAKEGRILDAGDRVRDYAERLLPQKVAIDLLYARRRTFLFDVKILVWTFIAVLLRKDVAVNRTSGDLTLRRRTPSVAPSSAAS
jgi:lipopolysaccharide/colanic/teichoic acid biosynthesis glycosyltransferase